MASFKKVKIVAANVHDGLGGVFYAGDTPVLPAEIADVFLTRNMAILAEEMTEKQAKEEVQKVEDARRQAEQKNRAEAVMKRHDSLPADKRAEANEKDGIELPRVIPLDEFRASDAGGTTDFDDAILDLEEDAKPDPKPRRKKKGGP